MKHFANSNLRFFSDLISTSAVKNHRLSLLLLMLFTLLLLPANMVAQTVKTAYAVLDGSGTLTFKYGDKPAEGAYYELNQVGEVIPGWVKEKPEAITKVVFDESFKQARPTTCYKWFQNCSNLETIENLTYLNTSKVTDMGYMFNGCSKLASLDLSKFNTEKVQHMKYMFADCLNLNKLDLSNFNTADVRNMNSMFNDCQNLTSLVLSKLFNTAKVKDMNNMFYNCLNLTSLDLSSFNTAEVTDMSNMFEECKKLTSLDLSSFNTWKVTSMKNMFDECKSLVSLDLSHFNTWRVTNMNYMFAYCSKLETIYSDHFDLRNMQSSIFMFNNCESLKGAIVYNWTNPKDATYAKCKDGYFTKLVGKNGSDKIGATGTPLVAENLTLDDDKDFVAYATFTAKNASYIRTMKEGTTWGTLCLPFEVSLEGQKFRAFTLRSVTEDAIELEEITSYINAGYPVIIKMNDGETNLNFTVADKEIAKDVQNSNIVSGYQLKGLYTNKKFDKTDDANCYIVKGGKLMNPAKMLEKSKATKVVSKPFRAYMVENSSAPNTGAKMFSIGISDSATAIDTLNAIANDKAEYFDLQGHRLNEPQKGINIVKRGNKTMKVIIK